MNLTDEMKARLAQYASQLEHNTAGGPSAYLQQYVPEPLRGIVNAANIVTNPVVNTGSLILDATDQAAKMATGGVIGLANAASHGQNNDLSNATDQALHDYGGQGFAQGLAGLRATNQNYAANHNVLTGIANLLLNPTNFIPMGAGGHAAGNVYDVAKPALSDMAGGYGTMMSDAAKAGLTRQQEAMAGIGNTPFSLSALMSDYKGQVVNKFRNSGVQDPIFNWAMAKGAKLPMADVGQQYLDMVANTSQARAAGTPAKDVLTSRLGSFLDNAGIKNRDAKELLGSGFIDSGSTQEGLAPAQSALAQVLYGLTTPRASVPIASIPFDLAAGYARPGWNEFMGQIGHVQQTAFRAPGLEAGVGKYFEGQGLQDFNKFAAHLSPAEEQALFASTKTRMAAQAQAGMDLAPYGKNATVAWISPADVLAHTKNQALADEWGKVMEAAVEAGSKYTKDVYGDFSQGSGALGNLVPFTGWVKQAYPRIFKLITADPHMLDSIELVLHNTEQAQENNHLPDYVTAQVPISTETPGVGKLASMYLGGRKGTMYVDPLGMLSPVGGEALHIADTATSGKKPVQTALDVASSLGIPGPNPLINYALYAGGLVDKTPTGLSAFSGIENAMPSDQKGQMQVPSLLNGPLNAARKAGGNFGISDPYQLVAAQMVFDRTNKPLSDPANSAYVMQIATHTGIYQDAKAAADAGGAARTIGQFFNPMQATAISDTSQTATTAKDIQQKKIDTIVRQLGMPQYVNKSPAQIAVNDPILAQQIQNEYNQMTVNDPNARINDIPSAARTYVDPRLLTWQQTHMYLNRISPTLYNEEEKKFKSSMGIN